MQPEPPIRDGAVTREPRPFLFLKPAAMPPTSADLAADGLGIERLDVAACHLLKVSLKAGIECGTHIARAFARCICSRVPGPRRECIAPARYRCAARFVGAVLRQITKLFKLCDN